MPKRSAAGPIQSDGRVVKRQRTGFSQKYARARSHVWIPRAPVPNTALVKLKYVTPVQLTGTAGATGEYVFRCGSIFDPDYTGVGHQPIGHDQWIVFYKNYIVVSAKMTAQFAAMGTVTTACVYVDLRDDPGSISTLTTAVEQPSNTYRHLSHSDGGNATCTLVKYYNLRKRLGIKDASSVQADWGGDVGNNPSKNQHFFVGCASADGSATVEVRVMVTIEYNVLFTNSRGLPAS